MGLFVAQIEVPVWRLKPAHDLFSSSYGPVTALNPVVKALVGPVVSHRRLMGNRLDVAAQFVDNEDPWLAEELCPKVGDGLK